jgi:hypothetical protein
MSLGYGETQCTSVFLNACPGPRVIKHSPTPPAQKQWDAMARIRRPARGVLRA